VNQTPVVPGPRGIPAPRTYTHAIARWMIRPLARTSVTPNHITTVRLLTGLMAAVAFALGGADGRLWAGLLFILSTLLDRADGELARITGKTSPGGHRYDLGCDLAANAAVFLGIGVGLAHGELGAFAVMLGILAGASVAGIFLVVFGLHDHGSNPQQAFGAASRFDLDDGLFLIAPIAWLDLLQPLLLGAAIGAPCFLVYALGQFWLVRRSPAED
jgi:archaetidylinositol phosphate synthase